MDILISGFSKSFQIKIIMKTIVLFFALVMVINKSYCQVISDTASKQSLTKAYFLQKSKNQKVGAWVLLVGGAAIFAGTGLFASQNLDFNSPRKHRYVIPISLSIACVSGSIPLFIAAGKNKLKAIKATAYFKIEKIPLLQETGINLHSYPAVSLKLNL